MSLNPCRRLFQHLVSIALFSKLTRLVIHSSARTYLQVSLTGFGAEGKNREGGANPPRAQRCKGD